MGMSEKEDFEVEKRNSGSSMNYDSPNMSSDWRFNGPNPANARADLFPSENSVPVCSSSCSPSPVVDSFGQTIWHDPTGIENPGFCGFNIQNNASSSNSTGIGNTNPASVGSAMDRPLDVIWNPPNLLLKGNGLFLPNAPGFLPQSLAQFPADSGFIERAARFSCFGSGNFTDMINNPLSIPESVGLYPQGDKKLMQGPQHICAGSVSKSAIDEQTSKNGMNVSEPLKDPFLGVEHNRFNNGEKSKNLLRSTEETKQAIPGSSNLSDEVQSSGGNGQNERLSEEGKDGETPSKGLNAKKRKRIGQDSELDQSNGPEQSGEAADNNAINKQKDEQSPDSVMNQMNARKQGKQTSDPPKEGYIHVRARRGQATNSHSLAERVRREKISERMKFLQDLVPGCNKVTGKAVMLDEIINYVQSLQRQVEFLSMKLATVNPRLDFNIEGLAANEALQTRPGPSTIPFPQDMAMVYPPMLHPSQPGLIQPVLSGMTNSSTFLQRTMNSQLPPMSGGMKQQFDFKETHVWEGDLHNVVQMSYGMNGPADDQDAHESLPPTNMKAEP